MARIDAVLDELSGTATEEGTMAELVLPDGTLSECCVFVRWYPLLLRPFPFEEFPRFPVMKPTRR